MDFVKNLAGGNKEGGQQQQSSEQGSSGGGGFLGGIGDKLNGAAGGGRESEKNEDYLDKGTSTPSDRCLRARVLARSGYVC